MKVTDKLPEIKFSITSIYYSLVNSTSYTPLLHTTVDLLYTSTTTGVN